MKNQSKSIVFLVSSNGGTLKFINEYLKRNSIPEINISYVIGDRQCSAVEYAEKNNIPNQVVTYNQTRREDLYQLLVKISPDLIITNIFKILDPIIVNEFRNRLINFHYSLLPAFKGLIGMAALKEAANLNCQFTGSTCHYVDEEVDNGKIISQCVFRLDPQFEEKDKVTTMFRANCIMALNSLLSILNLGVPTNYSISINNQDIYFSPAVSDLIKPIPEDLWEKVKSA